MATEDGYVSLNGDDFLWYTEPKKYTIGDGTSSKGMQIFMDAKTDFWQKTYYKPLLINDNGHVFYKLINDEKFMIETSFNLDAKQQFDQAGLLIRKDDQHWIKAGLEFDENKYKLSCVVTNTHSDWSNQDHPSGRLALRLYKLNSDVVMEYKHHDENTWSFCRICHLNIEPNSELMVGLMACAPTAADGSVQFDYLKITHVEGYHHTN